MMMDPDMIGAIKIKDGLFIGDELASTVSLLFEPNLLLPPIGLGIRGCQQSDACDQLCWEVGAESLGADWRRLPDLLLAGPGQPGKVIQILRLVYRCFWIQGTRLQTPFSNLLKRRLSKQSPCWCTRSAARVGQRAPWLPT